MVLDKKPPYIRIQSGWFKNNKDKIIKEFEPLVEEGTTVGGNKSEKRKSDVHLFDIWRLELTDFKKVIIFKVKEIFTTENKNYGFDLDYSTINVQFTRYQKDDFYEWHADDDLLNTHIKTHSIRKLSMSIPLNVGEYEGGEIEIKLSPKFSLLCKVTNILLSYLISKLKFLQASITVFPVTIIFDTFSFFKLFAARLVGAQL